MSKAEKVLLYSTTLHTWEVWSQSRPLAHGPLAACQAAYPDAIGPSEHQLRLAAEDPEQGRRSA